MPFERAVPHTGSASWVDGRPPGLQPPRTVVDKETVTARLTFLVVMFFALPVPSARASFPGDNGPLVLSVEGCWEQGYLAELPWRGGSLTPITDPCPDNDDDHPNFEAPNASPDGESVLALNSYSRGSRSLPYGHFEIARDGSTLRPVPDPAHVAVHGTMSFAPSGRRVVFAGQRRGKPRSYGIWTQRLDGSGLRRIWKGCRPSECAPFFNPQWSPDGKLLAVERDLAEGPRWRAERSHHIALMRVRDGKVLRRVTRWGEEPDWSPDGRRLVYRTPWEQEWRRGGASGGNLQIVSRDGTTKRLLLRREKLAETHPTWSPDGRWIAFVSLYTGAGDVGYEVVPKLWRVRPHGGTPEKIKNLPEVYDDSGYVAPQLTWLPEVAEPRDG